MIDPIERASRIPSVLRRTQVGGYVVSTVDLNSLPSANRAIVELSDGLLALAGAKPVRISRLETMVFRCAEDGETVDWHDLDERRYTSHEAAMIGHDEMLVKWLAIARSEKP